MRFVLVSAVVAATVLAFKPACAGEVIAHPSVRIGAGSVRDVFLGEKQFDGDVRLVAVDNIGAQDDFLAAVLQTNARAYVARWTRKAFREGLQPPLVKAGDAEVLSFVRSTPGAIGYVSGRASPGVNVIMKF
jgi:hypothetical protein